MEEQNLQIKGTVVLERIIDASKTHPIICLEGGSRSSKTWSTLQFFLLRALAGNQERITIARQALTWVKESVLKDFDELTKMYEIEVTPEVNFNRPDQTYYVNGTEFSFIGLDQPAKSHGRKQDWFWLNEVMEIDRYNYDQIEMRTTTGGIVDYNPYDDTHWVYELHKRDDVKVIHSTMLDNPFLPPLVLNKIRGYEPTPENIAKGTADSYMWDVYGLGKKAALKGIIYDWDIVDKIPEGARDLGIGLDFGFSNDEAAAIEIYKYDSELYFNELIFQKGLVNVTQVDGQDSIDRQLKSLNIGYREITADGAEPKSITELRNAGWNINGYTKGEESVRFGIKLLKGFRCHITRRSINIISERNKYKWAQDKDGNSTKKPVDKFNHTLDAIRYRVSKVLGNNFEVEILPANILA